MESEEKYRENTTRHANHQTIKNLLVTDRTLFLRNQIKYKKRFLIERSSMSLCSWGANMSKKIARASCVDFHT